MAEDNPGTVVKADADDAKRYWLEEGWSPGGYVRQAFARGLQIESRLGVNPFPLGMVGGTDAHSGISATEGAPSGSCTWPAWLRSTPA